MPSIAGRVEVNLTVRDLDRSAVWYDELLGMEERYDFTSADGSMRYVSVVEPISGFAGCLVGHVSNPGEQFDEVRTGLDHLEFLVARHVELQEWADRLDELGIAHSGVKSLSYTDNAMLTFRDPDAVEARNLAPLPADIGHTVAAALPISGLTAWQALIDHAHLTTGQTVLIHGAAGGVGSIAVQLARDVGAIVIGTGRATDRETALGLGVHSFVDLEADKLEGVGEVDVVLDVIGGEILDRSVALVRAGGACSVRPRPAHRRQDDHPGHRGRIAGKRVCHSCRRMGRRQQSTS